MDRLGAPAPRVGMLSLHGLHGTWQDNAWAQVNYEELTGDRSYADLYRWEAGQWTLRYGPKDPQLNVQQVLPWRRGLVVIVRRSTSADACQLVHVGTRKTTLLPWQEPGARVFIGLVRDHLVAVTTRDRSESSELELWNWASPSARPITHREVVRQPHGAGLTVAAIRDDTVRTWSRTGSGAQLTQWRAGSRWEEVGRRAVEHDHAGLIGDPSWHWGCPMAQVHVNGRTFDVDEQLPTGTRRWFSGIGHPVRSERVLLSDQPTATTWEPPEVRVVEPAPPHCP